ncbi:response regulator [Variovorax saccharolyticus]|uniref:response regulator n=1 Tax=Variovorax saccharolyticus TaxID=3053516 RepID=UPI002578E7B4|nr:response regulator [Variovorax sp. J31P216]MDM0024387.1 response regulator [Variovorax sp. J31P216]
MSSRKSVGISPDTEALLLERLDFERLLADLSECFADASGGDLLGRTEQALSQLVVFLGYDRCTFAELVAGDYLNVLCSAAAAGVDPLPRGRFPYTLPWFLGELRAGRVVSMARLPDDLPREATAEADHARQTGLRSHLSIPLRIGGRVTSVLSFAAMRTARRWPPDMIARLKIVGELIGGAIVLARTEEEARQLRRRVWHADRVARVSALTAAIAHDLNQPLTAILSNAQAGLKYLARDHVDLGLVHGVLEAVVREDKRAADTIRAMRALLRHDDSPRERIDLAVALREVLRLMDSELLRQDVQVETQLDEGCWVMADRAQVEQVALNLVLNAVSALQALGPARRIIRLAVCRREGGRIEFAVRDTGKGIAPDALESIFEPFWTSGQEGLGLGLAICRSIVESHNGRIWAESNIDGGASFRVELLAAPEGQEAAAAALGALERPATGSSEAFDPVQSAAPIVCVIDDDPAVREGIGRLLEEAGWTVATYGSADEFIDRPPSAEVACVLLDNRMPGLSGQALQARLLDKGSAPPIIFITGHGEVAAGIGAMKLGASDYLEKPVDADVLVAAVRRAAERHAAGRSQALAQVAAKKLIARLSPREREIMLHVVRGRLNKQIAADLRIAEQTVKQHRGRVMDKIGVRSVAELVQACEAAGLLSNQPTPPVLPEEVIPRAKRAAAPL